MKLSSNPAPISPADLVMRNSQDVIFGYVLFLLRLPDDDAHIDGWIGKTLTQMAHAFLGSPEFAYRIAPKLSAPPGSQPTFAIIPGDISRHFRAAMGRYCGLDPRATLSGMAGWRWALFWICTIAEIASEARKVSLGNGSLLQTLSAHVTWDVYGSLHDEIPSTHLSQVPHQDLNGIAVVHKPEPFGFSGQITMPSMVSRISIEATLYGERLWPIFLERETKLSPQPTDSAIAYRFVSLFEHETTSRTLTATLESQNRLQRRGQFQPATLPFRVNVTWSELDPDVVYSHPLTNPDSTQNFSFWSELADLDVEEEASENRDALATGRAHGSSSPIEAKLIAFYLPQFYQFAENDTAWGEGFTEWTNVVGTPKLFPTHDAPLLPADLGFYDQRSFDVRVRQADLARQYGLHGFCYYFYWFSGRQVMADVLQRMLRDGQPSLPFCLCWANEHWSRRWDGSDEETIVSQSHDADQDALILDDLARFFDDPRYIRINGAPVLLVYHLSIMPEPARFVVNLRQRAKDLGFPELMLAGVLSHGEPDPMDFGCDFGVQFPPHETGKTKIDAASLHIEAAFTGDIYDYGAAGEAVLGQKRSAKQMPGVMPRWDNSARRGLNAHIFHANTPAKFKTWLRTAIAKTKYENPEAPFVFINSWNEWAEGAVLEPDRLHGRAYLEAMLDAVNTPLSFNHADEATGSLLEENKFLGSWLGAHLPLMRTGLLRPGMPTAFQHLPQKTGYKCQLSHVDGLEQSRLAPMVAGTSCILEGWSIGDPMSASLYRYIVIKNLQTQQQWFAPCPVRTTIDLSHYGISQHEDEQAGFKIGLSTQGLDAGHFQLCILDFTQDACFVSILLPELTLT